MIEKRQERLIFLLLQKGGKSKAYPSAWNRRGLDFFSSKQNRISGRDSENMRYLLKQILSDQIGGGPLIYFNSGYRKWNLDTPLHPPWKNPWWWSVEFQAKKSITIKKNCTGSAKRMIRLNQPLTDLWSTVKSSSSSSKSLVWVSAQSLK